MKEQKIKSDTQISVGNNIREIRKSKKITASFTSMPANTLRKSICEPPLLPF